MENAVRAIRQDERAECLALWNTVFGDDPVYFRRYFFGDTEWLPYYTQVAKVDGRIVSAAHVVKRTVACGEMKLTMGGLANVATLPEYRGRGLNRQCVERIIAVMEADAMDFSLLFTGVNAYYAKMGYADLPRYDAALTIRPDFAPPLPDCAVRPARPEDPPFIEACYAAYNDRRPIAVQRSPAYWRDWVGLSANEVPETLLVVTDAENAPMGYIQVDSWPDVETGSPHSDEAEILEGIEECGTITEFAVNPSLTEAWRERAAFALLQAVTARFYAGGIRRVQAVMPLEPEVRKAVPLLFSAQEDSVNGDGMARLLHRENLFRGLSMAWNERWSAANRPQGVVAFETPYGLTQLDATGTFLKIAPVEPPQTAQAIQHVVSQSDFFRLLFGFGRLEALAASGDASDLLTALFPPQCPICWPADGF